MKIVQPNQKKNGKKSQEKIPKSEISPSGISNTSINTNNISNTKLDSTNISNSKDIIDSNIDVIDSSNVEVVNDNVDKLKDSICKDIVEKMGEKELSGGFLPFSPQNNQKQAEIVLKVLGEPLTEDEKRILDGIGEVYDDTTTANEALYKCAKNYAIRGSSKWADVILKALPDYNNKQAIIQINNNTDRALNIINELGNIKF